MILREGIKPKAGSDHTALRLLGFSKLAAGGGGSPGGIVLHTWGR